jgi:hypothetical protein
MVYQVKTFTIELNLWPNNNNNNNNRVLKKKKRNFIWDGKLFPSWKRERERERERERGTFVKKGLAGSKSVNAQSLVEWRLGDNPIK